MRLAGRAHHPPPLGHWLSVGNSDALASAYTCLGKHAVVRHCDVLSVALVLDEGAVSLAEIEALEGAWIVHIYASLPIEGKDDIRRYDIALLLCAVGAVGVFVAVF